MKCLLDEFVAYFSHHEHICERKSMGLQLIDDRLVWTLTGRELNLCDIEHFCCKIMILSIQSHSSRTISVKPQCCNYYCHPRPNPKEWDKVYGDHARKRWEEWKKLNFRKHPIPQQLRVHPTTRLKPCTNTRPSCTAENQTIEDLDDDDDANEENDNKLACLEFSV